MSTEPEKTEPSVRTKTIVVSFVMALCWALTAFIVIFGEPTNSLHTSALAWTFTFNIAAAGSFLATELVEFWNTVRSGVK